MDNNFKNIVDEEKRSIIIAIGQKNLHFKQNTFCPLIKNKCEGKECVCFESATYRDDEITEPYCLWAESKRRKIYLGIRE